MRLLTDNPRKGADYTHTLHGMRRLIVGRHDAFCRKKTIISVLCGCCISRWTSPRISKTSEPHWVYFLAQRAEIPSFHNGEFDPIKFTLHPRGTLSPARSLYWSSGTFHAERGGDISLTSDRNRFALFEWYCCAAKASNFVADSDRMDLRSSLRGNCKRSDALQFCWIDCRSGHEGNTNDQRSKLLHEGNVDIACSLWRISCYGTVVE